MTAEFHSQARARARFFFPAGAFHFFEFEMSARISVLKLHIARPRSPAIARARPLHVRLGGSSCSAPARSGLTWGFVGETLRDVMPMRISSGHGLSSASAKDSAVDVSDLNVDALNLSEFFLTGAKVTSVAHRVWRKVLRPGDTVIDATCGNGHDTLELARLVCADNAAGYVYAFDVQEDALANSSYLLDERLDSVQRKRVKLLRLCHSQLEKIVGEAAIRLVTFNLGYLPGGDHTVVTNVDTTIEALQASSNVLQPGGLISVVAYVGHPGGREEFEAVMNFAAKLPPHAWVCSQHEWVNRPLGPRLILMLKK